LIATAFGFKRDHNQAAILERIQACGPKEDVLLQFAGLALCGVCEAHKNPGQELDLHKAFDL
jgi:hypothetical protein